MHPHCKNCGSELRAQPERMAGELVVPCLDCGAVNVIMISFMVLGLL